MRHKASIQCSLLSSHLSNRRHFSFSSSRSNLSPLQFRPFRVSPHRVCRFIMGDDSLRYCKIGGRFRKDGTTQKGHAYASAHKRNHNLSISSDISSKNRSNFEENQFAPYFMENHKRRPNPDQTTTIKLENGKSSPSIIARLMGLKDLPPEKGPEKINKKSGGAFRKPSLSGNRHVEFKDVFEVIEERKGQNRKEFVKDEAFEGNFDKYRESFVKNLEKSNNPLFAKHLLELKCYPPHLHKGMISRLKSGYVNEHPCPKTLILRNSGREDNCRDHDHIVVLDPKMGNFLENLENRRGKEWRFENNGCQRDEYCNRNILKLEKLRRFDSNSSNKGTKSLAEMLSTPDFERSEKNLDSLSYIRKVPKSKFSRDGYYEKVEGSFANLPQKTSLLDREDVVRLKARNQKLRENPTLRGNFENRFCEKEVSLERRDLRGRSGNNFVTEEKIVFTIGEGQNEQEEKKHRNGKQRVSIKEKEECFSVTNFDRSTNSKEEIPSPISVLEPTTIETESCSSSFVKPDSDLNDNDMQITEEIEICTSSDDDSQGTTRSGKISTLNLLRGQEEREFSYLLDMLIQSGVHGIQPGTYRKACHSREFPVDPRVFDRLERRYGQISPTWSKADRRLLFDLANSAIATVLAPCLDTHPWVRCNRGVGPTWGPEGLVERVWLVLSGQREKKIWTVKEEEKALDFNWLENLGDEINVIGKKIERMLTDDILEETVSEFLLAEI